ncbi:MAG: VapC toxin family PIN domain ribonuclease [Spirochaetes bacterium]|nr:MAG: VapC toxin family PIN domain ribonuclease [Spirochaetota bacterium]
MISFDTNIIIYALNKDMPEHARAYGFLAELVEDDRVVVAEQTLVEVYLLIRNPSVFPNPYSPMDAVSVCQSYRANPKWRLVECGRVMEEVWKLASDPGFPRRRIIDLRLALTLIRAGVKEFATRNVKDFYGLDFDRVWDPTVG